MAEARFDRDAFESRLATQRLGRTLETHAEVGSTNDVAWEAMASGAPDGHAVIADAQTQGRGRNGRAWHSAPGKGLALSLLLHRDVDRRRPLSLVPLACGLALARALERFGVEARLKWPNDLLIGARKVAGVLVESRWLAAEGAGARALVIGVGVNVGEQMQDFPSALIDGPGDLPAATSLAIEGKGVRREAVAAELLNAFEPLWDELAERGAVPVREAWTRRASFWGERVVVRAPSEIVTGVARRLDDDGGLVLELADGSETVVVAGDLEIPATRAPSSAAAPPAPARATST